MRRRLLNLLTILSLLLCVAVVWGWRRSRGRMDNLYRRPSPSGSIIEVNSYDRAITATSFRAGPGAGRGFTAVAEWEVRVPYWLLTAATAIPPAALTARRVFHRRRLAEGLCRACGYDLRATPGRCPECGSL